MIRGWEEKSVGSIMDVTSVKRVHESDWQEAGIPFYRAREIVALHNGEKINPLYISKDLYNAFTAISGRIKEGDLLVTGVGTIGVPYLVQKNDKFYFKDGNIIWFKNENKVDGKFLYYLFDSSYIKNQIFSSSGKGTVETYTISSAKETLIKYPKDKSEQERISNILSNIDNLISTIEKLITKKTNIRNSLLNILINERMDNNKDYQETTLNAIGIPYNGLNGVNSSNFQSGDKRYITFLNVLNNPVVKETLFAKFHCNNKQNKVLKNDLFFNTSSETKEEVAMCSTILNDYDNLYLNSFCFGFRLTDTLVNNLYLVYYFRSSYMRNVICTIAQGSTRFNLPKNKFLEYPLYLPSLEEQKKSASILQKMDQELETLNRKLNKYKKIKSGMMDVLLSGEVRT